MVKILALVTLGVYLSCIAAAASSPGENPSTRKLRSTAAAEAQSHEATAGGAWTKLGNAMESKFRPLNEAKSTTGMEARVKAMNAPHRTMPNMVMEARKKRNSVGTKKADPPRNKNKPHMMETSSAQMKNLEAAAVQRAKLEALAMKARNKKKGLKSPKKEKDPKNPKNKKNLKTHKEVRPKSKGVNPRNKEMIARPQRENSKPKEKKHVLHNSMEAEGPPRYTPFSVATATPTGKKP